MARPRPTRITDFKIEKELGKGQFGTVFKASHQSGKIFALKSVNSTKQKEQEDAVREGELVKKMKHVNICQVLDVFWEAPSTVWILMEYCSKGSLTDRLKTASKQQCYMWVMQLLEALAFVHARAMIHRDIKSENILMAENLVLKLADFGLSRILPREPLGIRMTIAGTPLYLAPELLSGSYDNKVDVFSAGVVMYEMFNGGDLLFAPGEKCIGIYLMSEPRFDIYNHLMNVSRPSDTKAAECRLIADMLNPSPTRRLTIMQAMERFRPMLDAQCPGGYIAPQLEQPQWYDAKDGKPWAGSLLEKVKPFFPATNPPSMQRVVANKNLQLHMPVQSAYLALPTTHAQHRWSATLVLEFPATFPRQQALLSIKGEAALQWKVDKPYASLADDVLNLPLYVNGLAQLVSDGQATAVLVGLQAWPSAGGAAPIAMDLAPQAWEETPQGQSFITPLAAALSTMYGACRPQPNAFNARVPQYLFALPRPATETKGTCRARLVFPPLFPANPALGSGVLLLCAYNGSHTHQIINVAQSGIPSSSLTPALAHEFLRRLTDALVAIHGPLQTVVTTPVPVVAAAAAVTTAAIPSPVAVPGPYTPTSPHPYHNGAFAPSPPPLPPTSNIAAAAGVPPPPLSVPAPPPTPPTAAPSTPPVIQTLPPQISRPTSAVGYHSVPSPPLTAPPVMVVATPLPPSTGPRIQWYTTVEGKQMMGPLWTLLKVRYGECKMERSTVTGDLDVLVAPFTPTPRLRLEFPYNFPMAPARLHVGRHFPVQIRTQVYDAQRLVDEIQQLSEEISALPEPISPTGSSPSGGFNPAPPSLPPQPLPQWYTTESGRVLYDALVSLSRTEIGSGTRVMQTPTGDVQLQFERGGVCHFPYNFPAQSALVSLPPQQPIAVALSMSMASAIHAQCAFILEVKAHVTRLLAAAAATATPAPTIAAPPAVSRPITPSPSMPTMQVTAATPTTAASRPVAYDDDLVLDDDYVAPRRY